ncbi:hypothetical protein PBI_JACE_61 [Gordonia phage Jace]|uniref:Uncharacterized protein n=1 Tax=Gordonia phage Jace TaxID=2182360 RepID=A0A2U8UJF5_9CAUD|nr:hypothetical protein HOT28_gp61 [Gordonia phage Jace]AWN03681.1 hypothetical protein PBI_JACE_61 [Gordonia phage Jace]
MAKHSSEDRNVLSYRDTGMRYLTFAYAAGDFTPTRHDGSQRAAHETAA